jgi:hypothetical protein
MLPDHLLWLLLLATHASGVLAACCVAVAIPAAAASVAHAAYVVPAMADAAVQVEFAAAPVVTAQAKAENSSMPAHVLLAWLHGLPPRPSKISGHHPCALEVLLCRLMLWLMPLHHQSTLLTRLNVTSSAVVE